MGEEFKLLQGHVNEKSHCREGKRQVSVDVRFS